MNHHYDIYMGFGRKKIHCIRECQKAEKILRAGKAEGSEIKRISSGERLVHDRAWLEYGIAGAGDD
jgi:hypothetical protein